MAPPIDIEALRAFAIAASVLNMRRAAELLNISQPPLSRKIMNLESRLGARLFIRRSNGLELTEAGREILGIVQPLLAMQEAVQAKLDSYKKPETWALGFTTAFDQGAYKPLINALKALRGDHLIVKSAPSIQLANEVLKGRLLAAWLALPIAKPGLSVLSAPYSESLLAAIPEGWGKADAVNLPQMNGKPFFWFSAGRNPYWHERMGKVFSELKFKPLYIEEPLEYEVLLVRIAAGEGWALVPASFSAIRRKGVEFLETRDLPPLEMGIAYCDETGETLARKFRNKLKTSER